MEVAITTNTVKPVKKKLARDVIVYKDVCKACGICIGFCPTKILEADAFGYPVVARLEDCIACDLCTARCPDLAIEVIHEKPAVGPAGDSKKSHDEG